MNIFRMLFAAGVVAVSANAEAVIPQQETTGDECYLIGSADELDGFAKNVAASGFSGCAKLTADIHYIGNVSLLNSDRNGLNSSINESDVKRWTPLQNFTGVFDGQNHTIYGLYVSADDGGNGAAFIRDASGSAQIKNLHIADSYFFVNKSTACKNNTTCYGSAGFVSVAKETPTIDKCSFSGYVGSAGSAFVNNAGLVGYAADNSSLNLTNSYNDGNIVNGAGLVGNVGKNSSASVSNCYNIGNTTTSPLLGERGKQGNITVLGSNLGCYEPGEKIDICNANFGRKGENAAVGTFVSNSREAIVANYWSNIYGSEEKLQEKVSEIQQMIEDCKTSSEDCKVSGFELETEIETITYIDPAEGNKEISIQVPVGVIHILSDADASLKIPEDIDVYRVKYEREFTTSSSENLCGTAYNTSTTVLPFNISTSDVFGAKFYNVMDLHKNQSGIWTVGLQEVRVGGIQAHTPYVVCPTESKLTFSNGITIKKTEGPAKTVEFDRNPVDVAGKWKFVGLYNAKKFYRPDTENANEESGRAYVFMGGKFARAGNVSSGILRAYLLAPEGSNPNTAGALMKSKAMAAALPEMTASLPSDLPLEVVGTDEEEYAKADPADLAEDPVVDPEEGPLAIQKTFFRSVRNDQWRDVKGRSFKGRPSASGAYLNNRIPVIVK